MEKTSTLPIDTSGPEWDAARCVLARRGDTVAYAAASRPCLDQYRQHVAAERDTLIEQYALTDDDRASVHDHIRSTVDRVADPRPMMAFNRRAWQFPVTPRRLHCYLVPHLSDAAERTVLGQYVDRVREILTKAPVLTPTPDPWLHITLAWTADPNADQDEVVSAVTEAVAGIPPGDIHMGPAIAAQDHVRLAVADGPAATFARLQTACMGAFDSVGGPVRPGGDPQAHMTMAFADGPGPDRWEINAALATTAPSIDPASLTAASVLVIDGLQNADATDGCLTTWDVVAEIPLQR